jgi:hypothetical protein
MFSKNSPFPISSVARLPVRSTTWYAPRPRPFLQSQLARAQKQTFTFETDVSAKFASPKDTVLSKLEWYRLGGEVSDRQRRDILGVLKTVQANLTLNICSTGQKSLALMICWNVD